MRQQKQILTWFHLQWIDCINICCHYEIICCLSREINYFQFSLFHWSTNSKNNNNLKKQTGYLYMERMVQLFQTLPNLLLKLKSGLSLPEKTHLNEGRLFPQKPRHTQAKENKKDHHLYGEMQMVSKRDVHKDELRLRNTKINWLLQMQKQIGFHQLLF